MSDRLKLAEPEVIHGATTTGELEQLLAQPVEQLQDSEGSQRVYGIVVGTLVGFHDQYQPLVVYPGVPGTAAVVARTGVDLRPEDVGHEVTLMFEACDPRKPIVTGRIRAASAGPIAERLPQVDIDADGQRLTLTAKEQLVLRCGKASITLTTTGKVLIEGAYVSSRSSGVLRIKGGSVQIN